MAARSEDFVARFGKTASDYAYTDSLTDSDWVWEFLRRNPDYRVDYYESRVRTTKTVSHPSGIRIHRARGYHHNATKWGLAVFADPDLNALQTDIFWSQEVLSHSVLASSKIVESTEEEADLDLFRDRNCTAILCDPNRQKIIVRSRNAAIDMQLVGLSVLFQPVHLQFHLQGFASIGNGTKTLIWVRNALKSVRAADRRALTKTTRTNRKKYLVALDCEQKGASLRDTALVFRALQLTRLRWSSGDEALKKQVWRCRKSGLKLMQGGYRKLL
ncbi:MAG: DUF2285 domain-containing protein [Rhizobiaceae bacterium]